MSSLLYRIVAALTFFTRLPLWRLCNVPAEYYKKVIPLWPLAGWVTGGMMAAVFALTVQVLPLPVAVVLALVSRVLLTGALHEDGFADFCDGFGGGTTKQRTLEIMKDSHIGTYGVLGLVLYYLLMYNVLVALIPDIAARCLIDVPAAGATVLLMCDVLAKMISTAIVWFLPYARTAETAKNKLVYANVSFMEKVASLVIGVLPVVLFCPDAIFVSVLVSFWLSVAVFGMMIIFMHRRINGYTGDCCGAIFITTELTMLLSLLA